MSTEQWVAIVIPVAAALMVASVIAVQIATDRIWTAQKRAKGWSEEKIQRHRLRRASRGWFDR